MARIWEVGFLTAETMKKFGSIQRCPLLTMTGALQALAGVLPLDLEVKKAAIRQRMKACLFYERAGQADIDRNLEI